MKGRIGKNTAVILFAGLAFLSSCGNNQDKLITWRIDSTKEIAGKTVAVTGNPQVISWAHGKAVEFDGVDDGLLIDQNPLAGMSEFSIEIDLKPYSGGAGNREQRFLHIQDPENEDRRILLELRLKDSGEWYGDWFVKTEKESLTLIDSSFTHPVDQWATMSLEYKNGTLRGFINGKPEVTGKIDYLPVGPKGKTSVGTRMDQRSWFKGAIKEIRFFPEVSGRD